MELDLSDAYHKCEQLVKSQTTSFFLASKTLPYHKRRAVYAVYAFCRVCDDVVDNDNDIREKTIALNKIKSSIRSVHKIDSRNPIIFALKDVIGQYNIPVEYFEELIIGMESDLNLVRFNNFDELKLYCYRVASTVGLICLNIFGYQDEKCKDLATDLGIAMQLTNIIRDIKEDFELNRIYIPKEDFENTGYTYNELLNSQTNDNFHKLIYLQIFRAEKYFNRSKSLQELVSKDSKTCVGLIADVYIKLLNHMNKTPNLILKKRTSLTFTDKISLIIKCYISIIKKQLFIY